jgi:hypothetical protein
MITGALSVISNTPATLLNPLVLPGALGDSFLGFITVAHGNTPCMLDLLFLEGKQIHECGRMNRDARMAQSLEEAEARIRRDDRYSAVSLFHAPRPTLERFIATLRYEPCLKLQIDSVSRQQLERLIHATGCTSGILEILRWEGIIPAIELSEFESMDALRLASPFPKRGRLILYDRGSNVELLGEPERPSLPDRLIVPDYHPEPQPPSSILLDPDPPPHPPHPAPPADTGGSPPGVAQIPLGFPAEDMAEHVKLFEELFRSFRETLTSICKGKSENLLARAHRKTGKLSPPPQQLTSASAADVLDIIESVVEDVPLLKRSKVKSAALELVAGLYNKHHELLENSGCIDRVEGTYYQLKG